MPTSVGMRRLQMADRYAVLELLALANHTFDDLDGAGFAACFTAEGVLESSRGQYAGAEQLAAYVDSSADRPPHVHFTTNTVIRRDPVDRARLVARSNFLYVEQARPRHITDSLVGTYLDTLRLHGETWLIEHRIARAAQRPTARTDAMGTRTG
jgi:hypothetical protein